MRKINELISQELSELIARDDDLPTGVMITITDVRTSGDLGYCDVTCSILPDERRADALAFLTEHAGRFRSALARTLVTRTVPQLRFRIDKREQHAAHIDALIDKIHGEQ